MRRIVFIFAALLFVQDIFGQDSKSGIVMAVASEKGNIIRFWPDTDKMEEVSDIISKTRQFRIYRAVSGLNDLKYTAISTVKHPRTAEDFKSQVNPEDYRAYLTLLNLKSDRELTTRLAGKPELESMLLVSELKSEFLLAYGLAFLDKNVSKGDYYQYQVVREDQEGKLSVWGETSLFAKEGNLELDRVTMKPDTVLVSDSLINFRWQVSVPDFSTFDFPEMEDSLRRSLRKLKTYKGNGSYQNVLSIFNRYGLHVSNTAFLTYYRINEEKEWHYLEKNLASADSSAAGYFISSSVPCLPHDRVEAVIVPQDFAYNTGKKSEVAKGWAVTAQSVEFITAVNARDSVNSILLSWDKLPDYGYYAGIEVAKSAHDMERRVVTVLPPTATGYKDPEVFPAGTLYSYYVRPLFNGINGVEQAIPSTVIHSCTTFSKPSVPYNLKVVEEGGLIRLSWKGAEDEAFHSYHVLRGDHPNRLGLISGNIHAREYFDTSAYLSPKITHYYSVMAMNVMQDTSAYAAPVSFTLSKRDVLKSPALVTFEAMNDDAYLFWDDIKLNDTEIAGYVVQKSEGSKSVLSDLLESNFYVDKGFNPGTVTYYRVASVSIHGDTSVFSPATTAESVKAKPEHPPLTGITLTDLPGAVRVSWPAVLTGNISKFRVYRRLPNESAYRLLKETSPGKFYYEDTEAERGKVYVYTVTSVNSADQESAFYEEQTIVREGEQ